MARRHRRADQTVASTIRVGGSSRGRARSVVPRRARLGSSRSKVEMCRPWIRASAVSRSISLLERQPRDLDSRRSRPRAARASQLARASGTGPRRSALIDGKYGLQPVRVEVVGMKRADRDAPVAGDDPPRLGERLRTVDEVDDERHRRPGRTSRRGTAAARRCLPDADAGADASRARRRPSPRSRRCPRPSRGPRSASAAASLPVPQPTSSTRRPRRSPSSTSASNAAHQARRPAAACRRRRARAPKSGARSAAAHSLAAGGDRSAPRGRRGAARDEHRLAALGERDLDQVEVARHDGVGEQLARLLRDLAAEVAAREMRQREQPDAAACAASAASAAVEWLVSRARCALVGAERRLVDEQVDARRGRRRRTPPAPCRR